MRLKLDRPLIFFDLETTGVQVTKDRIVEISCMKMYPDGNSDAFTRRVNPEMPIPAQATKVHGISDEDVKDQPTFAQLADSLHDFFNGCDIGGYNIISFDVPLLAEEFHRVGRLFPSSDVRYVDAMRIFHNKEKRDLSAAVKFYCGRELLNAHSAEADVKATAEVFLAQMERYHDLGETVADIHEKFSNSGYVDLAGRLKRGKDGELIFAFGKHVNKKVKDNLDYAAWMLEQEFTLETKFHLKKVMEEKRDLFS